MTTEQPLVSWGEIATFLKVSKPTAMRVIRKHKIPIFHIGRFVAILPSTLIRYLLESESILNDTHTHLNIPL